MDEQIEQENEARALRTRMTRGTVGTAVQRTVELLIGLLMVPLTLQLLGQAAYGYWALVYAVANYMNLSDLGFTAALNHFFVTALNSGEARERRELFSSAFLYLLLVALLVLAAGLLIEPLILGYFPGAKEFGMAANWAWRGTMLVLALGFLSGYGRSLFYATHRVAQLSLLNTLFAVLYAAAVASVLFAGWGLTGMAIASSGVAVLRLLLVFTLGSRGVPDFRVAPAFVRRGMIAKLWRFGLRVFAARVAEVIYVNFDRVLLGRAIGVAAVTPYDVGAKGASNAVNVPLIMLPVIEPEAARFQARGETDRLKLLALRGARYTALIGIGLAGLLVALAPEVIALWVGKLATPRMVLALRVLVVAHITMGLTAPLRSIARGIGLPGWEARAAILQAAANVLLSILLYLRFGFTGVLFGTLSAVLIGQGVFLALSLKKLGLHGGELFAGSWLAPLVATLLAFAAAIFAKGIPALAVVSTARSEVVLPLLLLALVYLAVFTLASLLLRATTLSELTMLLRATRGGERR